jgi:hypothetical protein
MIFLLEEDRFICSRRDPFRGPNRDGPSLNGRQQRQWEAPHDEVEKMLAARDRCGSTRQTHLTGGGSHAAPIGQ